MIEAAVIAVEAVRHLKLPARTDNQLVTFLRREGGTTAVIEPAIEVSDPQRAQVLEQWRDVLVE